ncbi:exodeoxyribonuclease VII large subunit [soil metagenome]
MSRDDDALDLWSHVAAAASRQPSEPARQPSATSQQPSGGSQDPAAGPRIQPVGELTRLVRDLLRGDPRLRDLWVEGEVGQVSISAAGHCYFTLKDERAQLRCMIFRDDRLGIPFEPQTGLQLVAHGRIDLFEPQGHYQLYVDSLQPAGFGDLALRFEALKARLAKEGLFDPARKRPLPAWPAAIGLATSLSGAVIHDMRKVLARRWPMARVLIAGCQVQGPGAPNSVVAALARLARWRDPVTRLPLDVLILARGGGSLEDLWAFNEEIVVRAVAASPVPIVVGVGHETDVTLAEFAADVRAATPSVAAELVVPSRDEQLARLRTLENRLSGAMIRHLATPRAQLDAERRALERFRPGAHLATERERIGMLLDRAARALHGRTASDRARLVHAHDRLPMVIRGRLARARADLGGLGTTLAALNPDATLERGYAVVRDTNGLVLRDARTQPPGSLLDIRLAHGSLDARVEAVRDSAT